MAFGRPTAAPKKGKFDNSTEAEIDELLASGTLTSADRPNLEKRISKIQGDNYVRFMQRLEHDVGMKPKSTGNHY